MGRVIRSLVPTAGSLPEVDLTRLRGPYELPPPRRWFKHKRWQYGMVSTPNVLAVVSVADLTYIANAFACAVDLTAKKLLFDRGWMGVPGPWISVGNRPGLNARARFLMPGVRFAFGPIEQARQYRVEVESYGKPWAKPVFALKVQLVSPPEPSPLTVIRARSGRRDRQCHRKVGWIARFGPSHRGRPDLQHGGRGVGLRLHAGLSRPAHRLAVGVCEWSAQRWTDHRLQHCEGNQRRSRAKRERSVDWFETDSAGSGSIYVQSEQSHG